MNKGTHFNALSMAYIGYYKQCLQRWAKGVSVGFEQGRKWGYGNKHNLGRLLHIMDGVLLQLRFKKRKYENS